MATSGRFPVLVRPTMACRRAWLRVEELEPRTVPTAGFLQIPNDPQFSEAGLYGLGKIQAEQAWDLTTGRPDVVVADIDSGIDYTHPDLYLNIWINQQEIPEGVRNFLQDLDGDGVITFYDLNQPSNQGAGKITDLNSNGYIDGGDLLHPASLGGWADGIDQDPFTINGRSYSLADDLIGWDFRHNDNDPWDTLGHGTHTAGTIGAIGNNNLGVVGVNWAVSIMPLRIIDATGLTGEAAIDAIYYAVHHGVRVSNNSWGGYGYYAPLYHAIQYAGTQGHVFVAAAGNDGVNNDRSADRLYPASFDLDNIIAVAATDENDVRPQWSNYGRKSVDLGAPGVSVLSTVPTSLFPSGYVAGSGTSFAAPHVTGTVGLILAYAREQGQDLTVAQIKAKILNSVDPVPSLDGKTVTGGRLNAWKALTEPGTPPPDGGNGGGGGKGNGKGGGKGNFASLASDDSFLLADKALGWSWFIDPALWDESEFTTPGNQGEQDRMDLRAIRSQEIGHQLGYEDREDGIMREPLMSSIRPLPGVHSEAEAGSLAFGREVPTPFRYNPAAAIDWVFVFPSSPSPQNEKR